MKTAKKARIFTAILAGLAIVGNLWAQSIPTLTANAADSMTVKLTGYIIDEDCFVKAGYADPGRESRGCLLMKSCASSGYGLAVLQNDGTYKFYYFDGTFAPLPSASSSANSASSSTGMSGMDITGDSSPSTSQATGGQALAASFITDKITNSNVPVTVNGSLTDSKATNPNSKTADGVYYQVLKADSIEVASKITPIKATLTGYLSDAVTFLNAQQNKTDPTVENKEALLSSAAAANGYGVVVKTGNTYRFYYLDGDFSPAATGGQKLVPGILTAAKKNSHIELKVTGSFEGHYGIYTDAQSVKHANPVVMVGTLAKISEDSSSSLSSSTAAAKSVANPQTGIMENWSLSTCLLWISLLALLFAALTASLAVVKKSNRGH
jgi:hypothetical protein